MSLHFLYALQIQLQVKIRSYCGGNEKIHQFFFSIFVIQCHQEWVQHPIVTATAIGKWVSWQQMVVFTLWRQWQIKKVVAVTVCTRLKHYWE